MSLNVQKFRHQLSQLEVEAAQFDEENGPELVKWAGGQYCLTGKLISGNEEIGHSFVLPHDQIANLGDYIVKGLDDVFWVAHPRVIIHTYDLVVEPPKNVINFTPRPPSSLDQGGFFTAPANTPPPSAEDIYRAVNQGRVTRAQFLDGRSRRLF